VAGQYEAQSAFRQLRLIVHYPMVCHAFRQGGQGGVAAASRSPFSWFITYLLRPQAGSHLPEKRCKEHRTALSQLEKILGNAPSANGAPPVAVNVQLNNNHDAGASSFARVANKHQQSD
jgi:hypothetical protein